MLQEYVKGYLTAVYYLTEPFFDPNFETPKEIQKALSTGIMIFTLWKRYLEVKKMKLHSQATQQKWKNWKFNAAKLKGYDRQMQWKGRAFEHHFGPRGREFERFNLQKFKCPGFAWEGGGGGNVEVLSLSLHRHAPSLRISIPLTHFRFHVKN